MAHVTAQRRRVADGRNRVSGRPVRRPHDTAAHTATRLSAPECADGDARLPSDEARARTAGGGPTRSCGRRRTRPDSTLCRFVCCRGGRTLHARPDFRGCTQRSLNGARLSETEANRVLLPACRFLGSLEHLRRVFYDCRESLGSAHSSFFSPHFVCMSFYLLDVAGRKRQPALNGRLCA